MGEDTKGIEKIIDGLIVRLKTNFRELVYIGMGYVIWSQNREINSLTVKQNAIYEKINSEKDERIKQQSEIILTQRELMLFSQYLRNKADYSGSSADTLPGKSFDSGLSK